MNMKKVELLSPAGNLEKLKIALAYGADAVYGGISHFNLRIRSSKEFNLDSFKEGIDYTHRLGKKIYVTINGFPFNSQISLLKEHIKLMASLKPDGFIVSTPGVISLCKELAPNIELHLSTQANVMNYLDAKFYYDIGIKRIIAAREISLKDIIAIKGKLPDLEIEIFVHGSMCFAYSGRCLISSLQLGRVPNRGSCANDCRFDYTLYAEHKEHGTLFKIEEEEGIGTYIFNAKDLNLSSHIKEILDSNAVDSVKIEGRTKSAYYTAITAYTYKMAIDDYYKNSFNPQKYQNELNTTKNRGFTDAYLLHRPFERDDTQNYDYSLSAGSYEVSGIVTEDGEHFMCKYKTYPSEDIEILSPPNTTINIVDNEIGSIKKKGNKYFINFKKIVTQSGKELSSVHSGNQNRIRLPIKLPNWTIFRKST